MECCSTRMMMYGINLMLKICTSEELLKENNKNPGRAMKRLSGVTVLSVDSCHANYRGCCNQSEQE